MSLRRRTGGATAFSRVDTDGEIDGDLHVTGNAVVDNMLTTQNLTVTHYWQSSDRRLKTPTAESPVSAPDGTVCPRLAARLLLRLPAHTYFMRKGESKSGSPHGKCHIGHFAQEVRDVLPTAVREDPKTARLSLNYNELHVLGTCVAADAWKRVRCLERGLALTAGVLALCVAAVAFLAFQLFLVTGDQLVLSWTALPVSEAALVTPVLAVWKPQPPHDDIGAESEKSGVAGRNVCSVPVEFAICSVVIPAPEPFAALRSSTHVTSFDQPYFCAS